MNLKNSLLALLPDESLVQIAIYVENNTIYELVKSYVEEREGLFVDLKSKNLRRLPYGGEFFETLVIENDEIALNPRYASEFKRAIQKNRDIIIISSKINQESLKAIYEPLGFSDFSLIESDEKRVLLAKKWFTFQQ